MATPRIDRIEQNFIINGAMDFWQRVVAATSSLASGDTEYTADRFFSSNQGATAKTIEVSRDTDVPSAAASGLAALYSHKTEVTVAAGSLANAADLLTPLDQRIEGLNYAAMHGKKVTVGFWFKASVAGSYTLALNGAAFTRSYVTTFSVASNAWTYISKTIQLENSGSYNLSNGVGLELTIGAISGSSFSTGVLDQWQTGNYYSAASSVNWAATLNATIRIALVSVVNGDRSQLGSFARAGRNISEELELCQRYYEKSYDQATALAAATAEGAESYVAANAFMRPMINFKTRKRAQPAITLYGWTSGTVGVAERDGGTQVALGSETLGERSFTTQGNGHTDGAEYRFQWQASAEL